MVGPIHPIPGIDIGITAVDGTVVSGERQPAAGPVEIEKRDPDLFQVVRARVPPGGLAGALHGRQQEADQDRDDRDHHQEFDEREACGRPSEPRARTHRQTPPCGVAGVQSRGAASATPDWRLEKNHRVCSFKTETLTPDRDGVQTISNRSFSRPPSISRLSSAPLPVNTTTPATPPCQPPAAA